MVLRPIRHSLCPQSTRLLPVEQGYLQGMCEVRLIRRVDNTVLQGVSTHRLDGSFVATILETAAVGVLYLAWRSITEGGCLPILNESFVADHLIQTEDWDDTYYPR